MTPDTLAKRFPVAVPSVTSLEEEYVHEALRSGWISSKGKYLDRFETAFAELCGAGFAIATSSGTTALHLALSAAGVRPGDEVVVPALTYVATANAVTYCGARPVFVDVDPKTLCIDADQVSAAIGPRTVAVVAVDLYGHPADYARLRQICTARGLLLVADAAQSLGGFYRDLPVGDLADLSTFSFFGNKILSSGEGGCVTTSDEELAGKMRILRNQGMDPARRYFFPVVGYNYRLTNLAAALLCAQVERSSDMVTRRHQIFHRYEVLLGRLDPLEPLTTEFHVVRAPWLVSALAPPSRRDALLSRLGEMGVDTRPFFVPMSGLPPYASEPDAAARYPVAYDVSARGFNLPTYYDLSDADVTEIVRRVGLALESVS